MSRDRWAGDFPPRTTPIRPADGIRARSKRGAFAAGWWAKRWIAMLEAVNPGSRLSRGRSYARTGQVTQIAIEPGGVRASVQGSRTQPYTVTIRLRELNAAQWQAVGSAIMHDVRLCSALLAGEMPEDIERAFSAAQTSLFPLKANEMKNACSCPDWSNPCKHIAAVFYLMGEEFDRDPFLLFVLRGLERDAVRDLFSPPVQTAGQRVAARPQAKRVRKTRITPVAEAGLTSSEIAISLENFWGARATEPKRGRTPVEITSNDEPAVLKRAGAFPFWRADTALADLLLPVYNDAAALALEWLADHAESDRHDD